MKIEIGHYVVNDKIYPNKFEATLEAQKTNQEIKWYFFDDEFKKIDWYKEPELSLDELYRLRAQQIRQNYDYVIVFCSGGSDSNNVIRTFLNNKIHVDEVISIAPLEGLKNWNFDNKNNNEDNTISETKFALMPLLKEISEKSPNTKITINDYFSDILKESDDYWTHEACGNIVTTLTSQFTEIIKFKHIEKIIEQGKRIALVYGTEKPIIRFDVHNNMYFVFSDSGINYLNMPGHRSIPTVDRILFYWSPDLPELLVKQAHVVGKIILLPENRLIYEYLKSHTDPSYSWSFAKFNQFRIENNLDPLEKEKIFKRYLPTGVLNNTQLSNKITRFAYERFIIPYIYPSTYTKNLFQCEKVNADEGFFAKDQNWVHILHKNTRLSEMIISGKKSLYNSISENYLNKNGTSFKINLKYYKFGNETDFIIKE